MATIPVGVGVGVTVGVGVSVGLGVGDGLFPTIRRGEITPQAAIMATSDSNIHVPIQLRAPGRNLIDKKDAGRQQPVGQEEKP